MFAKLSLGGSSPCKIVPVSDMTLLALTIKLPEHADIYLLPLSCGLKYKLSSHLLDSILVCIASSHSFAYMLLENVRVEFRCV